MASHRSHAPKRTHADLLGAATDAYAEHHAHLRAVAQAAADTMKRKADSAEMAAQTRPRTPTTANTNTPTGR